MRSTWPLLLLLAAACSETTKPTGVGSAGGGLPFLDSATLSPDPGFETSILLCAAVGASDPEGDDITLTYAWEVNGVDVGVTLDSLEGRDFDKGDDVQCLITPSDASGAGSTYPSNVVTILNSPPTGVSVEVTPAPATVLDTLSVLPAGWADADGDDEYWRYEWFVNGGAAPGGGETLAGAFAKGDQVYVVATPDDGEELGTPVQSDIVNIVNTPPSLATATVTPSSPTVNDALLCSPGGPDDVDGDPVGFAYQWYVAGLPAGSGTDTLTAPAFSSGQDVYCEITPNDGEDNGAPVVSNTVIVGNSPPEIGTVTLGPDPADEGTTLICTPNGMTDPDGDMITPTFTWTVAGLPVGVVTSQLTGADFDKGDAVQCTVTPDDGVDSGATVPSNVVVISNSAPSASSVSIQPGTAITSDTLTAVVSGWSDADGDPEGYSYQWFKNGLLVPGAVTSSFASVNHAKNDFLSVEVTPFDGEDAGMPLTSSNVTIQNSLPSLTSAMVTPPSPLVSDTLTCTGTGMDDLDNDMVTLNYQWYADGLPTGTNSSTLAAPSFGRGQFVYCEITPNDGQDNGTAVNSNIVEVFNSVPTVASVDLTPDPAWENTILDCGAVGEDDADGDPVTLYYSWSVAGLPIGATTQTLDGTHFDKNQAVQCFVTPGDGLTFGVTVASNVVVVGNTAPSAVSVSVSPSDPHTNDDVSAVVTGWDDLDGDAENYRYQWYKNGLPVPGAITPSFLSLNFVKGELLAVEVTPDDGQDLGTPLTSLPVTVLNTEPEVVSATLTPSNPTVADTLNCANGLTSDLDNDLVTLNYQWFANGMPVGGNSGSLDFPDFANGQDVWCIITPFDGEANGTPVQSNTVTVENTPPVIGTVTLEPQPAYEGSLLSCNTTGVDDVDGDTVDLTYEWTVAGLPIAATGSSLDGADFDKGDAVQCTVTPDDGTVSGTPVGSNVVTIQNTPPSASNVEVTPVGLRTDDPAIAEVFGWTDVDSDSPGYDYQWYVNSIAVSGATTDTLSSGLFVKGNLLRVDATPNDGTDTGATISSLEVQVQNTPPVLPSANVSPANPTINDILVCTEGTGASDADNDMIGFSYEWFVNGYPVATGGTLSTPAFASGDAVYCEVTPDDGEEDGLPVQSNFVGIGNSVPTIASVTLDPDVDPAYEDTTLTCIANGVFDGDGDPVNLTYAWSVNSITIPATGTTLDGADFSRSDNVQCHVTPDDGANFGATVSSNSVIIQNSPPSITGALITTINPTTSNDLTAEAVGWYDPDNDSPVYEYQWFADNNPIPGAVASVLSSTSTVKGMSVTVEITPTDGLLQGAPVLSAPLVIENTPPTVASANLGPADPVESDLLTCDGVGWSDADNDAPDYQYAWYVQGALVTGENGPTLTGADFDRGEEIWCVLTPDDGQNTGPSVQSNSVFGQNSAPSVTSVDLTASPAPVESGTLICNATATSDPDQDVVTVAYSWAVGGVPIAPNTPTLDGVWFDKGEGVQCFATPSDGLLEGPAVGSNLVVIGNTAPTVGAVSIVPFDPKTLQNVTAVPTGWNDVDQDAEGYDFQWFINGVPSSTTEGLSSTLFVKDDILTVQATPDDGDDLGPPVMSLPVTVLNTPPTAPDVEINPPTPDTVNDLLCSVAIASTDDDSDPINYAYTWNLNGLPSGTVGPLVLASQTSLGQNWECVITAWDGEEFSLPGSDSVVVSDATAPNAPVLDPIEPYRNEASVDLTGVAEVGSTVTLYATCDGGSSGTAQVLAGLDGSFSFQWSMNPGEFCSFYVDAEDSAMNISPPSNTVFTTACSSPDPFEGNPAGYGDDALNAISEWGVLGEPSSAILEGNMFGSDPGDWFRVSTEDDAFINNINGYNEYNFRVELTAGIGDYAFIVHKGSIGTLECPTELSGYDDYNDYWYDRGDAPDHVQASPTDLCSNGSSLYNQCESMANTYWIEVIRLTPPDCTPYQITVSNAL